MSRPSWPGRWKRARCTTCAGTTRLPDTIAALATFLKGIAPNQLVADGGDGFDDDPSPYAGLSNYYAVRGDDGCSFSKLSRVEALDMLSYHFYPRNYGFSTARDAELWIDRHQDMAMVTGKIAYLGECGFAAPDVERAQNYDDWLRHLFALSGGQLGLFWQLSPAAGKQRRLRGLLAPRQRDHLDPRPLGQGHSLNAVRRA